MPSVRSPRRNPQSRRTEGETCGRCSRRAPALMPCIVAARCAFRSSNTPPPGPRISASGRPTTRRRSSASPPAASPLARPSISGGADWTSCVAACPSCPRPPVVGTQLPPHRFSLYSLVLPCIRRHGQSGHVDARQAWTARDRRADLLIGTGLAGHTLLDALLVAERAAVSCGSGGSGEPVTGALALAAAPRSRFSTICHSACRPDGLAADRVRGGAPARVDTIERLAATNRYVRGRSPSPRAKASCFLSRSRDTWTWT